MPLSTPIVFEIFSKSGSLVTIAQCDYDSLSREEPLVKEACAKKGYTLKLVLPHTPYSLVKFLETVKNA
jgi:hypothetical protein